MGLGLGGFRHGRGVNDRKKCARHALAKGLGLGFGFEV